jgi:hypothetical protein
MVDGNSRSRHTEITETDLCAPMLEKAGKNGDRALSTSNERQRGLRHDSSSHRHEILLAARAWEVT